MTDNQLAKELLKDPAFVDRMQVNDYLGEMRRVFFMLVDARNTSEIEVFMTAYDRVLAILAGLTGEE